MQEVIQIAFTTAERLDQTQRPPSRFQPSQQPARVDGINQTAPLM